MDSGAAGVTLRPAGAGAAVLELRGRLGGAGEALLLDAHTRATTGGAERLILDLGAATFDAGVPSLLVKLHTWCDGRGQRLLAFGASALCRAVLRATRLDHGIDVLGTEAEALAAGPGAHAAPPASVETSGEDLGAESAVWALALPDCPGRPGQRTAGPLQGFGALWEKVHRVRLAGAAASAPEVGAAWRERFGEFWPPGNDFLAPDEGLRPGAVVDFRLAVAGGLPLRTGAVVLHADDQSFTLMTLEGHLQAGWITFGVWDDAGTPVAEVRSLTRSSDPLCEAGFVLAGHHEQDEFWHRTLEALGRCFGVTGLPMTSSMCVDPRRQWGRAGNAVQNAGIRTALDAAAGLVGRLLHPGRP